MDRLSQELIDLIASFAIGGVHSKPWHWRPASNPGWLAALATINSRWQYAVERYTFHDLTVASTQEDLEKFRKSCVASVQRRRHLTTLRIHLIVSNTQNVGGGEIMPGGENAPKADAVAFTEALKRVFDVLKIWDEELTNEDRAAWAGLHVVFEDVYSPQELEVYRPKEGNKLRSSSINHYPYPGVFRCSEVRLAQDCYLPELAIVRKIELQGAMQGLDMHTCIDIMSKLTGLETIILVILYEPQDAMVLRGKMGEVLRRMDIRSVKTTDIMFFPDFLRGYRRRAPPNLEIPPLTYDPMSAGLRDFSRNLTSLTFAGQLDATFFDVPQSQDPFWPNLQRLELGLAKPTPTGNWYLIPRSEVPASRSIVVEGPHPYPGPRPSEVGLPQAGLDHSSSMEVYRRIIPNDEHLRPVVMAFATAASRQMPRLMFASLGIRQLARYNRWEVRWVAPGWSSCLDEKARCGHERRRLQIVDAYNWAPDCELLEMLKSIGENRYDDETAVHYLPSYIPAEL